MFKLQGLFNKLEWQLFDSSRNPELKIEEYTIIGSPPTKSIK